MVFHSFWYVSQRLRTPARQPPVEALEFASERLKADVANVETAMRSWENGFVWKGQGWEVLEVRMMQIIESIRIYTYLYISIHVIYMLLIIVISNCDILCEWCWLILNVIPRAII